MFCQVFGPNKTHRESKLYILHRTHLLFPTTQSNTSMGQCHVGSLRAALWVVVASFEWISRGFGWDQRLNGISWLVTGS